MYLNDHDLKQISEDGLHKLSDVQLLVVSIKLLSDLKDARDRLNRNPQNSSRPPSTQAPWEKATSKKDDDLAEIGDEDDTVVQSGLPQEPVDADVDKEPTAVSESNQSKIPEQTSPTKGRPGRRPGTPGVSRTQKLPITSEQTHRPERCALCDESLATAIKEHAYTARYEIDVTKPGNGMPGLVVKLVDD